MLVNPLALASIDPTQPPRTQAEPQKTLGQPACIIIYYNNTRMYTFVTERCQISAQKERKITEHHGELPCNRTAAGSSPGRSGRTLRPCYRLRTARPTPGKMYVCHKYY